MTNNIAAIQGGLDPEYEQYLIDKYGTTDERARKRIPVKRCGYCGGGMFLGSNSDNYCEDCGYCDYSSSENYDYD